VPADLALVGFDNVEWAAYCRPPLTTVEFPLREIGRRGVALALDLARGGTAAAVDPLPTRLVVRDST
jgi:LacI family repressor for deo operon, udp, cdd, tsx, nupC, and nupG